MVGGGGSGWGGGGGVGESKFNFSEIQPNLACELLTCMTCATAQHFGAHPHGALGRGQKIKHH